jgi:iron(III) transport system substrate-binding protein
MRAWSTRVVRYTPLAAIAALLVAACAAPARPAAPAASAPAGSSSGTAGAAAASAPVDAFTAAKTLSMEELHQRALAEGGALQFYSTLSQSTNVVPTFEQRFPGVKVEHLDMGGDKLMARIVTESRAGKVLGDVFQTNLEYVEQINRLNLLVQDVPLEAAAYPAELRGSYWTPSIYTFIVPAWNTNLVRPDEAPRGLEDLADPRWRGRLIAEPSDWELVVGLIKKLGEERATEVLRQMAANNPEFHSGHADLAELLAGGHAAACLTCFTHHYPTRQRRGAPVDYLVTEGVGQISVTTMFKDAPRPYTAMLLTRWSASEEGQAAYAASDRIPVHPNVPPKDRTRPDRIIAVGSEELAQRARYERIWKETFQLR